MVKRFLKYTIASSLLFTSLLAQPQAADTAEYEIISVANQFDKNGKHKGTLEKVNLADDNLLKIFQVDIRKDALFSKALDNSIDFYSGLLVTDAQFNYGDEIYSAMQMLQSLKIFKELAMTDQPFEDFLLDLNKMFDIYQAKNNNQKSLLTGYYTPNILTSKTKTREYCVPLYLSRAAITKKTKPDFFVKNISDIHALVLEGAGIMLLSDGSRLNIEYSGRVKVSFQKPKIVSKKVHLAKGKKVSKHIKIAKPATKPVFQITNGGPFGCINVPLTPKYTAAMDRELAPLGGLVYVKSKNSLTGTVFADSHDEILQGFESFMLVQDIGGAIKGGGRVDIYFGEGNEGRESTYTISKTGSVFLIVAKKDILYDNIQVAKN